MIRPLSSLRGRLILANASLLTACLGSFSLLLYAAFGSALSRHFDDRLAADAATVAHLVEENADGSWEFEGQDEFEDVFDGGYFEVHLDDRRLFARSRSLGERALRLEAWSANASVREVLLPDGKLGRVYLAALAPRAGEGRGVPSGRHIWVAVARATSEFDATMATLRLLLWGFGLTSLALASIVCVLAIGRGLKPLGNLLSRVDGIDARRLGERLPVEDLPRELQPLASKLNELLRRIEVSFSREREWSLAVGHELRNPLAGLRAILDVVVSRERSASEYQTAIVDARQITTQMSTLVDQLLLLARLDAHAWDTTKKDVRLRQLIDDCFAMHQHRASARRLRFDNRVAPDVVIVSDPDKLSIVVGNLLDNAVDYSSEGGEIRVESDVAHGSVLEVSNHGVELPEAALQSIFDPFVRLESARSSNGEHCGIGLTLVRALCEALGFSVTAHNRAGGLIAFRIAPRTSEQHAYVSASASASANALADSLPM